MMKQVFFRGSVAFALGVLDDRVASGLTSEASHLLELFGSVLDDLAADLVRSGLFSWRLFCWGRWWLLDLGGLRGRRRFRIVSASTCECKPDEDGTHEQLLLHVLPPVTERNTAGSC